MKLAVRRTSTAEAVELHLRKRIASGEFAPGHPLPSERDLQVELGVGRSALREGLARLSALGIIRMDQGVGASVQMSPDPRALRGTMAPVLATRDPEMVEELLLARRLVEGELAGLAATKRTPEDIEALRTILDKPGEALESDSALARLDYEFHYAIARIANNRFLTLMLEVLSEPLQAFLTYYVRVHGNRQRVIDRHRPILDAIAEGDADRACAEAQEHIGRCDSSIEAYVNSIKSHPEM